METNGAKIRHMRKKRSVTLQQLASNIGVSVSAVSQYERGIIKPDAIMLFKIARALGCPLSDIVSEAEISRIGDEVSEFLNSVPPDMSINESDAIRIRIEKENELNKAGAITCTFLHEAFATAADGMTVEVMFNEEKAYPVYVPFDVVYSTCTVLQKLNPEGREKALSYLFDLLEIPRYRQEVTQCPEDAQQTDQACSPGSDQTGAGNADIKPE